LTLEFVGLLIFSTSEISLQQQVQGDQQAQEDQQAQGHQQQMTGPGSFLGFLFLMIVSIYM
jgi:hypothetical protein